MQTTPETEQVTCCSACLLVPYLYPYDARAAARAKRRFERPEFEESPSCGIVGQKFWTAVK